MYGIKNTLQTSLFHDHVYIPKRGIKENVSVSLLFFPAKLSKKIFLKDFSSNFSPTFPTFWFLDFFLISYNEKYFWQIDYQLVINFHN